MYFLGRLIMGYDLLWTMLLRCLNDVDYVSDSSVVQVTYYMSLRSPLSFVLVFKPHRLKR